MIEHVVSNWRSMVSDQMGVDENGKPMKLRVLAFESQDTPGQRYAFPMGEQDARNLARQLNGGIEIAAPPTPPADKLFPGRR
jgi:hypothetical protein